MKRSAIVIFFVIFGSDAMAQTERRPVPGSSYSLIPPEGFVPATTFMGFGSGTTGASIMINELPVSPDSVLRGLTAESLSRKGMRLISRTDTLFADTKAVIIYAAQSAYGIDYRKEMLIFGDARRTAMITGSYPESSQALAGAIHRALLSTKTTLAAVADPSEAATFTIDTTGSGLRLAHVLSGTFIYNADGKVPGGEPSFIVANSLSKVAVADRMTYTLNRFRQLPGAGKATIRETVAVTIDDLPGYSLVALNPGTDPKLMYMVMLYTEGGGYYLMFGSTEQKRDESLAIFRRLAASFRRKR